MLAEMELRHLRYFVAVAEEENVSRAALKLHVSQPGISRQIHDLEDEIGFQLFERSAKSVKLTGAGKVFLTEARVVLQHADDAVKKARAVAGGTSGEINVGYAPSLTIQILPQALRKFQEKFPGVRVALHDLSTEEMLSQIGEKKLQVALTVRPSAKLLRGLNFEELARYAKCAWPSRRKIRWRNQNPFHWSRFPANRSSPTAGRIIPNITRCWKNFSRPWDASRASLANTTA